MYKALKSFSGLISMSEGEVREIADKKVAKDLLRCNYIEETPDAASAPAKKETKKKAPKGG